MARPSKAAPIDYAAAHDLVPGLLDRATCPAGRPFVLVKDSDKKGLRLRVTLAGGKHWQFESRLRSGKLFTRSLGEWPTVSIADARDEAHRLRGITDKGTDPRELDRQRVEEAARSIALAQAQTVAETTALAAEALTVGATWAVYLVERGPRWGELHRADHVRLSKPGGVPSTRGTRGRAVTVAGPLHPLLLLRLRDLDAATVEAWAAREGKTRPTAARLAWRLLKAFLGWCAEQPQYAALLPASNPAKTKRSREALGRPGVKSDALLREQLPGWFAAVRQIQNPVAAAYLQTLLLLGARPGEVLAMRWEDVNIQWRGLTIRDKVEGERVVPLTPYVAQLLAGLPRRNEWVFATGRVIGQDAVSIKRRARYHAGKGTTGPVASASKSGHISEPNGLHSTACTVAGVKGLTLHGLRRSFKSLTEWLEIPAGVVAQLMGHKPSATAEKHCTVRPLDLLRVHHERIEAWILEQAGVTFDAAAPAGLRVVASVPHRL